MATDFSGYTTGPHLDLPTALSKIGEMSSLRDMLGMLADLLVRDMPKIQQALLKQDMAVAGRLLHSLKGCMPIFCTVPICDQVALVGLHAKLGESSQAQQTYALLEPALVELVFEIRLHVAMPEETLKLKSAKP